MLNVCRLNQGKQWGRSDDVFVYEKLGHIARTVGFDMFDEQLPVAQHHWAERTLGAHVALGHVRRQRSMVLELDATLETGGQAHRVDN